jgi:hypothetical protein
MFIAVINEGFAIAEEEKHKQQMQAFVKQTQPQAPTVNWITRINPYRFIKARPGILTIDNLPTNLALPAGQAPLPNHMTRTERSGHSHESSGTFISSLKRAAARKDHGAMAGQGGASESTITETRGGDEDHWDVSRQL